MMDISTPAGVRATLADHGLRPSHALGQNFLVDAGVRDRIVAASGVIPGETVLEVGPGLGVLTEALLAAGARVVAVEKDQRLAAILRERLPRAELDLVVADALTVALAELLPQGGARVVSNLPYYVTSPLLVRLLPLTRPVGVFMVQEEVGRRLLAPPGSHERGAITLYGEAWGTFERVLAVPRGAFYPQPDVGSVVLRFRRGEEDPPEALFRLTRTLFSFRRKTLRAGLRRAGLTGGRLVSLAERFGPLLDLRPEDLSLADFLQLLAALGGDLPVVRQPHQGQA